MNNARGGGRTLEQPPFQTSYAEESAKTVRVEAK
jgi:hypothetical protein